MMEDQSPLSSSGTKKKTKEHSKEVRDAIVQLHAQGNGYKKIAKSLDLPEVTVSSIIKKWKVHHTTETLPRTGRPSKLSAQRRNYVRKAKQRPTVTLMERQSSVAETGVKNENVIKTGVKEEVEETRGEEPCKEGEIPAQISTDSGDISGAPINFRMVNEEGELVGIEQVEVPLVSSAVVKRKTKEYSKEVRDLIVQMHASGKGYKRIAKSLEIPKVTVQSIVQKWKKHQTTDTLPRTGRPSKLSAETRNNLVREATERPTVTLMELQSSVAETGVKVHKSTISRALHTTGLYARMVQKRPSHKMNTSVIPPDLPDK